jgi:hypothetical protein
MSRKFWRLEKVDDSWELSLRKLCISTNSSLRAQRSNPLGLTNQALMDRRVASLLAMTGLCRPSLRGRIMAITYSHKNIFFIQLLLP